LKNKNNDKQKKMKMTMAKETASAVCNSCCIAPEFRTERTEVRIRSAHEEEEEKEMTKETAV
jgi:hypothetical protein